MKILDISGSELEITDMFRTDYRLRRKAHHSLKLSEHYIRAGVKVDFQAMLCYLRWKATVISVSCLQPLEWVQHSLDSAPIIQELY